MILKMIQASILAILLACLTCLVTAGPRVKIRNGTLEGTIMKSRRGVEFAAFRGIPYALPPLGELRFEPPRPAASWSGLRSAKEDAGICTQRNIYTHQKEVVGVEDCLYLNVYTLELPPLEDGDNTLWNRPSYPVMIWFHGGGWVTGAGHSEFYGPKFLLDHDVILVTVNFRLGPLGFLSYEDLILPGNQGMKDQAQSIRWVSENIAAFGGDPNRVTLFGESAGGVSVHYHMMSPLSKDLFHRGISQSGTALCFWGLTRPGLAKKQAQRLGRYLNCPNQDSKSLLSCLREKDAVDIIGTDKEFQEFDYCPMIPFRPVIEPDHPGAFLKEDPAVSLKAGRIADIPWMTGITSHEGALRVAGLLGLNDGELARKLNDDFMTIAPMSLLYRDKCPADRIENVTKSIREFYFGDRPIDQSTKFDLIDLYSDAWFSIAADNAVRDHLNVLASPVYYYYLAYRGSASFSSIFGDPKGEYGVCHADDLQYLFPVGEQLFKEFPLSVDDHKVVDIFTSLWYNFAKSGNPTPVLTKEIPIKWKPVRTLDLEYLHIGSPKELFMADNLIHERVKFWEKLGIVGVDDSQRHFMESSQLRDEL
ncbi:venom carboxylesterase-6 [Cephus cinctus]|uniref:Carboxylic ester hydrolase n=1 Tax=Cephus cinctus TaxID=211228 RepID=A0AAJ7C2C5_CEPCN|nr:venom carboxylesterase-6 [Cephus cinctus]